MAQLDLVRPLCLESPTEGGTQAAPVPRELDPSQDAITAAGLFVQNAANSATDKTTLISRTASGLSFADVNASRVLSELVSLTRGQSSSHQALIDAIHFLSDGPGDGWASGAVCVDSYQGMLKSSSIWYTDSTQQKRILAYSWTYTGLLVATEKLVLFAADGTTSVRTITDAYTYAGSLRVSRTRTWS